ncbi:MAG: CoA pyrophosphatase [Bacteroidota bacterium]
MKAYPEFAPRLKNQLAATLPGWEAQSLLAPALRKRVTHIPENARQSAVLMLVYQHAGELFIPFMRRAQDGRVHGGQISLPGGKREPGDRDFTHTAVREAHEEMNIRPNEVDVLGPLSEIYIPPSNFIVYPKVGFAPQRPDFIPNPTEVDEIIEIPVGELLEDDRVDTFEVDIFGGNKVEAPGFMFLDKYLIWGGTAMIVAEMVEILKKVKTLS